MNINIKLKKYIEENVLLLYTNNFIGDEKERVDYVMNRSGKILKDNNLSINDNILYTAISYHDIRENNDEKQHELTSAKIMYNDKFLKNFFTEKQRLLIKEAIEDQRSNSEEEPRSIYGKILSSASRNSSVEQCLERSYKYGKSKNPNATDEKLFKAAYKALLNKFGENGYAKFYFKDPTYEQFLRNIRKLLSNKDKFIEAQKQYAIKTKA